MLGHFGIIETEMTSDHRGSKATWSWMKARCLNPKTNGYHNYGGRGITICERWKKSFESFLEDMGDRPEGMVIDRIDTNGNYEPNNCHWVTLIENSRNRRNNVKHIPFVNGESSKERKAKVHRDWVKRNQEHRTNYMKEWHKENKNHCRKVYRAWRIKNKERRNAYNREWFQKNKERVGPLHKSYCAEYYRTHREQLRQYGHDYNMSHKKEVHARNQAYYKAHREEMCAKEMVRYWARKARLNAIQHAQDSRQQTMLGVD